MKRDYESLRDEHIAALTQHHTAARMALLRRGDALVCNAVSQSVSAAVTDKWMDELVKLSVTDERAAGAKVAALVRKVVESEAETDAIRDVEQIEKQREQDAAEERAEQGVFVRWAMGG